MNQNKDSLRELWNEYRRLMQSGKPELSPERKHADELYKDKIWPLTRDGFSDRVEEDYAASFHTVGTTFEPIYLSARALNPKQLYLLHTPDTVNVCQRVMEELGWGVDRVVLLEVGRSNPEEIYEKISQVLQRYNKQDCLAFDPTGGTKAMVAGLAMFAFSLSVDGWQADVYYVDNSEYDTELRRPVAGTEFLKRLDNPLETHPHWLEWRGREFFTGGNYIQAKEFFERAARIGGRLPPPEAKLAEIYDRLLAAEFAKAAECLRNLLADLAEPAYRNHSFQKQREQLTVQAAGIERVAKLAAAYEQGGETRLSALQDDMTISWTLAALMQIGARREKEGRLAETSLLYYRGLELFFQHRLAKRGIDTACPSYPPENLEEWQQLYREKCKATKVKTVRPLGDDEPLDLVSQFLLLQALGDAGVAGLNPNRIVGLAKSRNSSVFAHGFMPPTGNSVSELAKSLGQLRATLPQVDLQLLPLE